MTIEILLRRLAEGFAVDAYPKWKKSGFRIANYRFDLDGQHHEWLAIIGKGGQMKIWQHYPTSKLIGQFSQPLLERLVRPAKSGFGSRAINTHIRGEARRRR